MSKKITAEDIQQVATEAYIFSQGLPVFNRVMDTNGGSVQLATLVWAVANNDNTIKTLGFLTPAEYHNLVKFVRLVEALGGASAATMRLHIQKCFFNNDHLTRFKQSYRDVYVILEYIS